MLCHVIRFLIGFVCYYYCEYCFVKDIAYGQNLAIIVVITVTVVVKNDNSYNIIIIIISRSSDLVWSDGPKMNTVTYALTSRSLSESTKLIVSFLDIKNRKLFYLYKLFILV